jgi:hypothetical protein
VTMMEAIKKVRERDDALDLVFRKARSYNAWLPTPVLETFITSASPTNPTVDRGIKLRIAVDARALDFGRTYCGNASTHRGR